MNRAPRRLPLRITAGFFAFVFWLPSLALTDLVLGLIPDSAASSHAAGNVAYGIIGAVLIAPALASQVRRPERGIAPLQQIALVAVALACAALASGEPVGLAGAVVVLIPLVVLLALHPDRRAVLRRPRRPSVPLLALTLAAAIPALVYVWEVASNGGADLPPEDSFAYVPSLWSAAAGMALGTILVAVLAALRPPGWLVSAGCVAVAALLFGIASNINPDIAASGGRGWGSAAIVWSLAWIAVAARGRASDTGHGSLAEQDRSTVACRNLPSRELRRCVSIRDQAGSLFATRARRSPHVPKMYPSRTRVFLRQTTPNPHSKRDRERSCPLRRGARAARAWRGSERRGDAERSLSRTLSPNRRI